jgi:CubicO group peptidase (beta-lactamase class C family)
VLLSYVAESVKRKSFRNMVEDSVLKPLKLTHTYYAPPNDSVGIVPGDRYKTSWAFNMGEETPSVLHQPQNALDRG